MRDGVRPWTTTSGHGPPVVLLNGGPGMADDLLAVASALEDRHTVHRYEQRGCGRSDGGPLRIGAKVSGSIRSGPGGDPPPVPSRDGPEMGGDLQFSASKG